MIDYPNTFPFPNEIINGWNARLKGSELKVLLVVVRKTLGWLADPETGMRKEEDWINYSQLLELTGLTTTPVSDAIDSLVKYNLIQVRNKQGKLLNTKEERRWAGRRKDKFIYRLNLTTLKSKVHYSKKSSSTTLKSRNNKINILQKKEALKNSTKPLGKRKPLSYRYLDPLSLVVKKELSQKFDVPEDFIQKEAEKCLDWLKSKGRRQKDYAAFFRNWLRKAIESNPTIVGKKGVVSYKELKQ